MDARQCVLVTQIENSYDNDTRNLREHFKSIKLQFGEIRGMGLDRLETLWRAFNSSIEEIRQICDILHETFNNYLEYVEICVVDESVIGYQPGSKAKKKSRIERRTDSCGLHSL
jgi:DNA integrity scanning protein DisA with diadenylate cyclase activity